MTNSLDVNALAEAKRRVMPDPKYFFHKYLTIFLSHEIKIAAFSLLYSVIGSETRPTSHQLDANLNRNSTTHYFRLQAVEVHSLYNT